MDTKDFIVDAFHRKRKSEEQRVEDSPETKIIKLENCCGSDRASINGSPCSLGSSAPYIKVEKPCSPFRPWSTDRPSSQEYSPVPCGYASPYLNYATYVQEEPLALVVDKKKSRDELPSSYRRNRRVSTVNASEKTLTTDEDEQAQDLTVNLGPQEVVRIPDTEKCKLIPKSKLLSQDESSINRYVIRYYLCFFITGNRFILLWSIQIASDTRSRSLCEYRICGKYTKMCGFSEIPRGLN